MEQPSSTPTRPGVADVETLAASYLAAWRARDLDRIVALHAPGGSFHLHAPGSPPALGRAAIRDSFAAVLGRWPDLTPAPRRLLCGAEHWVLDWSLEAEGEEGAVRLPLLDLVTVSDGLVDRKDTYLASGEDGPGEGGWA